MKLQATILTEYSFNQRLFCGALHVSPDRKKHNSPVMQEVSRFPNAEYLCSCDKKIMQSQVIAVVRRGRSRLETFACPLMQNQSTFFFCKGHSRLTLYTRSGARCVRVINWSAFKSLGKKCKTQQSHYRFTAQILIRKRTIHCFRRCVMGQAQF